MYLQIIEYMHTLTTAFHAISVVSNMFRPIFENWVIVVGLRCTNLCNCNRLENERHRSTNPVQIIDCFYVE